MGAHLRLPAGRRCYDLASYAFFQLVDYTNVESLRTVRDDVHVIGLAVGMHRSFAPGSAYQRFPPLRMTIGERGVSDVQT